MFLRTRDLGEKFCNTVENYVQQCLADWPTRIIGSLWSQTRIMEPKIN